MKHHSLGKILIVLALILLMTTAVLAFANRNAPVWLTSVPEAAQKQTQLLADAVNAGDFAQAGQLIYGQPDLEGTMTFENVFLQEIWQAYRSSLRWSFSEDCRATDTSLCRTGTVTALDISGLLPQVKSRYEELLPVMAKEKRWAEVYNQDHSYQESFVMEVLVEAVEQVLEESQPMVSRNVTLQLAYRQSQWWIQPDAALMSVFSGGLTEQEG